MSKDSKWTIAIDFDGTCVEHDYPAVGMDVEGAVDTLRALNKRGHRLILYTMRSGEKLEAALKWFKERKITLWAVNRNPEQEEWTESPKVFADLYIDDSALGCPIMFIEGVRRPVVKWAKVRSQLEFDGVL
ncbi:MAG: HAD family hydrolase [Alistipes sp.]|nr:HAD family hydrolase [Alistipes sp.]